MSSICIVIPCYNEFNRFNKLEFIEFLTEFPDISFLLVDDGSSDKTAELIKGLEKDYAKQVQAFLLKENSGKAEAVRLGVLEAYHNKYDFIGFWDADFSAPLFEINNIFKQISQNEKVKVVLGSRIKRMGATIVRSPIRHYFGRVFSTLSSTIVKLPVYDSQCGAKVFRKQVIQELFSEKFLTKWLFDVELLVRYRNIFGKEAAISEIEEYPLNQWKEVGGSKIKLTDFFKVPFELLRIKNKYNR